MKLVRTNQYQFGWLLIFPLLDVVFLMIFFLLLSSNFGQPVEETVEMMHRFADEVMPHLRPCNH